MFKIMNIFGVYILQSLKNGKYYIGSTNNISCRLDEHNLRLVFATKFIKPLGLKVFIDCDDLRSARISEYRLKKYKNKKILDKVIISGIFPWKYRGV